MLKVYNDFSENKTIHANTCLFGLLKKGAKVYEKIFQSQGGVNTNLSCQCCKELVLNPCVLLRAVTVNGGGSNEQGHTSPGSATSLVWDLRQTLTSMGFNVCIYSDNPSYQLFSVFKQQNPIFLTTKSFLESYHRNLMN